MIGLYEMTNDEYHAAEGISRSGLLALKESTLGYYERYINKTIPSISPTPAMILGSLVHTLVLEPHKFDIEYCRLEKFKGTGSRALNELEEIKAEKSGKQIVDTDLYLKATDIAKQVLAHDEVRRLMKGARIEPSLFWRDKETDILCKARPDIWDENLKIFVDLKTASNASLEEFIYSSKKRGYLMQAAMQIDASYFGYEPKRDENFVHVVIPTHPPYKPYIYYLDQDAISAGREEYKTGLKILKKCLDTGEWDKERTEIIKVNFSNWQLDNSNSFTRLKELYA